jgi:hypothetical protein
MHPRTASDLVDVVNEFSNATESEASVAADRGMRMPRDARAAKAAEPRRM